MADSDSTSKSGGLGVLGVLQIIFWTLNVLDIEPVASWSLWWVNAPILISAGLFVLGTLFLLIAFALDR